MQPSTKATTRTTRPTASYSRSPPPTTRPTTTRPPPFSRVAAPQAKTMGRPLPVAHPMGGTKPKPSPSPLPVATTQSGISGGNRGSNLPASPIVSFDGKMNSPSRLPSSGNNARPDTKTHEEEDHYGSVPEHLSVPKMEERTSAPYIGKLVNSSLVDHDKVGVDKDQAVDIPAASGGANEKEHSGVGETEHVFRPEGGPKVKVPLTESASHLPPTFENNPEGFGEPPSRSHQKPPPESGSQDSTAKIEASGYGNTKPPSNTNSDQSTQTKGQSPTPSSPLQGQNETDKAGNDRGSKEDSTEGGRQNSQSNQSSSYQSGDTATDMPTQNSQQQPAHQWSASENTTFDKGYDKWIAPAKDIGRKAEPVQLNSPSDSREATPSPELSADIPDVTRMSSEKVDVDTDHEFGENVRDESDHQTSEQHPTNETTEHVDPAVEFVKHPPEPEATTNSTPSTTPTVGPPATEPPLTTTTSTSTESLPQTEAPIPTPEVQPPETPAASQADPYPINKEKSSAEKGYESYNLALALADPNTTPTPTRNLVEVAPSISLTHVFVEVGGEEDAVPDRHRVRIHDEWEAAKKEPHAQPLQGFGKYPAASPEQHQQYLQQYQHLTATLPPEPPQPAPVTSPSHKQPQNPAKLQDNVVLLEKLPKKPNGQHQVPHYKTLDDEIHGFAVHSNLQPRDQILQGTLPDYAHATPLTPTTEEYDINAYLKQFETTTENSPPTPPIVQPPTNDELLANIQAAQYPPQPEPPLPPPPQPQPYPPPPYEPRPPPPSYEAPQQQLYQSQQAQYEPPRPTVGYPPDFTTTSTYPPGYGAGGYPPQQQSSNPQYPPEVPPPPIVQPPPTTQYPFDYDTISTTVHPKQEFYSPLNERKYGTHFSVQEQSFSTYPEEEPEGQQYLPPSNGSPYASTAVRVSPPPPGEYQSPPYPYPSQLPSAQSGYPPRYPPQPLPNPEQFNKRNLPDIYFDPDANPSTDSPFPTLATSIRPTFSNFDLANTPPTVVEDSVFESSRLFGVDPGRDTSGGDPALDTSASEFQALRTRRLQYLKARRFRFYGQQH